MILDTNGLSAAVEGDVNLETVLVDAEEAAIPVIVLGEYRYGISLSRNRKQYEQWLAEELRKFRILDIDERTTVHYTSIRSELRQSGKPIPSNDYWIAALCRQHQMPIVSRDRHFDLVPGISRIDW